MVTWALVGHGTPWLGPSKPAGPFPPHFHPQISCGALLAKPVPRVKLANENCCGRFALSSHTPPCQKHTPTIIVPQIISKNSTQCPKSNARGSTRVATPSPRQLPSLWFTPTILFGHYGAAAGGRAANAVLDTSSGTLAPDLALGLNQDWRLPILFFKKFGRCGPPR